MTPTTEILFDNYYDYDLPARVPLTYSLASYLTHILTFYVAFDLAYILTSYQSFYLTSPVGPVPFYVILRSQVRSRSARSGSRS